MKKTMGALKLYRFFSFIFLLIFIFNLIFIEYLEEIFLISNLDLQRYLGIAECFPDNCFCESFSSKGLIQKMNSYSNIFFLYTGIIILYQLSSFHLIFVFYSFLCIFIGWASFFYHATFTFTGNWLDLFSMYMMVSFIFIYLFYKFFNTKFSEIHFIFCYLIFLIISGIFLSYSSLFYKRLIFFVLVIFTVFLLILIYKRIKSKFYLNISFIILFIAYLIWILDYKKILCFPDSLLQGHSIWHLANAIVLYTFFLFIKKNS